MDLRDHAPFTVVELLLPLQRLRPKEKDLQHFAQIQGQRFAIAEEEPESRQKGGLTIKSKTDVTCGWGALSDVAKLG